MFLPLHDHTHTLCSLELSKESKTHSGIIQTTWLLQHILYVKLWSSDRNCPANVNFLHLKLWRWYRDDWFSLNQSIKFFHWLGQENAPQSPLVFINIHYNQRERMRQWVNDNSIHLYTVCWQPMWVKIFCWDYNLIDIPCDWELNLTMLDRCVLAM